MIPAELRSKISQRITDECGADQTIGWFLFHFSALESDRDVEYALEELEQSNNPFYKKAINIVLEELVTVHAERYPSEQLQAAAIVQGYTSGFPAPYEPWHHIDNADNDLLREIIKQLVNIINLLQKQGEKDG